MSRLMEDESSDQRVAVSISIRNKNDSGLLRRKKIPEDKLTMIYWLCRSTMGTWSCLQL